MDLSRVVSSSIDDLLNFYDGYIITYYTYLKNCEQMMLMKAATFYKQEILDTVNS